MLQHRIDCAYSLESKKFVGHIYEQIMRARIDGERQDGGEEEKRDDIE